MAVRLEHVDEAVPGHRVSRHRPVAGVGDKELAVDVLDGEGAVPQWLVRVGERFETARPERDLVELAVDDVDLFVAAVDRVEEVGAADLAEGEAEIERG